MKHSPDENRIEELLENLPPGTSGKLDSRLSNAPWTPRAVTLNFSRPFHYERRKSNEAQS